MKIFQKNRNNKSNKSTKKTKVMINVKNRIGLVFFIVLGLLLILFVRISLITSGKGDEYKKTVLAQQVYSSSTIQSKRGEIWDRNGTKLAIEEKVYNLIIDPSVMIPSEDDDENLEPTIKALVYCFGYDETTLKDKITENIESKYIRYQKQLSEALVAKFNAYKETYNETKEEKKAEEAANKAQKQTEKGILAETQTQEETAAEETTTVSKETGGFNLISKITGFFKKKETTKKNNGKVAGIWFEDEYKRVYPYDSLACDTVGFYSSQGTTIGLEGYYDDILSGTDGRRYGYVAEESSIEKVLVDAKDGNTLVSTIDAYIQQICESVVGDYDKTTGSKNTSVLVMNPKNGEIYAMASSNPYNLNTPNDLSDYYSKKEIKAMSEAEKSDVLLELWQNYCVSNPYEPGSTAKIFTISGALEENIIQGNESYICDGVGKYGGVRIHCYNRSGHGKLNVTESLMYSCNDCLMQIAMLAGKDVFCKYQTIFGIGQSTGIDIQGEVDCSNLIYTADKMGIVDLATNSFGQNFYTTAVQMAAAYSSVVNGGNYYTPHLVKQILDSNGNVVEDIKPTLVRKTVSSRTSEFIKNALYQTCEEGSGKKAAIPGYQIGGKTGTAEKNDQGATGKDETYVVSFMAVVPAFDPEAIIYAVVDEPNIKKQSDSSQATKICKSVMEKILPYLNIYPTQEVDEEDVSSAGEDAEGIEVFEGSIIEE